MKTRTLAYSLTGFLLVVFGGVISAQTFDAWVEKYSIYFVSDGTGLLMASSEFKTEVPIAMQADVLSNILDRALAQNPPDYRLAPVVILFLGSLSAEVTWSPHLEKTIYAQAKSPNDGVRSCVALPLGKKQKDKVRILILSFQEDSSDQVRADFMDSIKKWPDAEPIYLKYIQTHKDDPNYVKSLAADQECLRINRLILKSTKN